MQGCRDACACIGLLSTCDKHAAAFRSEVMPRSDDGVIEVLLSLIPPLTQMRKRPPLAALLRQSVACRRGALMR